MDFTPPSGLTGPEYVFLALCVSLVESHPHPDRVLEAFMQYTESIHVGFLFSPVDQERQAAQIQAVSDYLIRVQQALLRARNSNTGPQIPGS